LGLKGISIRNIPQYWVINPKDQSSKGARALF